MPVTLKTIRRINRRSQRSKALRRETTQDILREVDRMLAEEEAAFLLEQRHDIEPPTSGNPIQFMSENWNITSLGSSGKSRAQNIIEEAFELNLEDTIENTRYTNFRLRKDSRKPRESMLTNYV